MLANSAPSTRHRVSLLVLAIMGVIALLTLTKCDGAPQLGAQAAQTTGTAQQYDLHTAPAQALEAYLGEIGGHHYVDDVMAACAVNMMAYDSKLGLAQMLVVIF